MPIHDNIYIKRRFVVRSLPCVTTTTPNKFEIREVTYENIPDATWFNTPDEIECFHQFLNQGYKGYFVYINGEVAHRIWIFNDSKRSIVSEGFLYKTEPDAIIAWVLTHEKYRGNNVFPLALQYLRNRNKTQKLYGVVASGNVNSIRGFTKAGFELYQKFVLFRLYRIKLWVQYQKQGKLSLRMGIGSVVS